MSLQNGSITARIAPAVAAWGAKKLPTMVMDRCGVALAREDGRV
jgi:hypothetical protein